MAKSLKKNEVKKFEEEVVPKALRGKHKWPIEVEALGQTARLRLVRGKSRIYFDWVVPAEYRAVLERKRFLQEIPKQRLGTPAHEDPGHNPQMAKTWLTAWLREMVTEAETGRDPDRGTRPGAQNRIQLESLAARFRQSQRFLAAAGEKQDTWDRWLDFLHTELGPDFRMHDVSPDVLLRLVSAYQKPWERTLKSGKAVTVDSGAGHNTAAKMVRFFKTLCLWGASEPDKQGGFLLDKDPFGRIRPQDMPREHETTRRPVGTASEEFASDILEDLRTRGDAGQALLIFGLEAALGRRPGEVRVLERRHVLTTQQEIADALRVQGCRRVLPDQAIPEDEIEAAAEAYAERGFAVRFQAGKQIASDPNAAQHDRVVPLGRRMTAVVQEYLAAHWDPLRLGPDAPLCPASSDPTRPTSRHVADQWFKRARASLLRRDGGPALPPGQSHTLRHRFRTVHRRELRRVVAFVAGWSLREPTSMDSHYLPVLWEDIIGLVDRIDETTAAVL